MYRYIIYIFVRIYIYIYVNARHFLKGMQSEYICYIYTYVIYIYIYIYILQQFAQSSKNKCKILEHNKSSLTTNCSRTYSSRRILL